MQSHCAFQSVNNDSVLPIDRKLSDLHYIKLYKYMKYIKTKSHILYNQIRCIEMLSSLGLCPSALGAGAIAFFLESKESFTL